MQPGQTRTRGIQKLLNQSVDYIEAFVWLLFGFSILVAFYPTIVQPNEGYRPVIQVSGLTRVMWPYVTLLTGIVLNFSKRYLYGNHRIGFFFLRCLLFLFSVMLVSATDHMIVFLIGWLSMGWFMSRLIAHKIDWPQARAAGRLALQYFLAGTLYLGVGIVVLYEATGALLISENLAQVNHLTPSQYYLVMICFVIGALIQSSLFPVQDWLMSSMTAPTPASALMHAGFVNAGGILLTKFAPLLVHRLTPMLIMASIGAVSALMGKIWKMVQTAIKRQLGCSTIAQMGFMLLQCGLGFFSAAISHLILHGFYKGYLFLNSGNAIDHESPEKKSEHRSSLTKHIVSLLTGLVGGGLFVLMTGKGVQFNSGLFLAFIVVLTLLQSSREVVEEITVSGTVRHLVFPVIAIGATFFYAVIFNGITLLMSDLPNIITPTPFTWVHGVLAVGFIGTWIFLETRLYNRFDRLYVYILNASQPHPATVLSSKEEYHV